MHTPAYADLTFAFGLAQLGEADRSQELEGRAAARLEATGDTVHRFLLAAFRHRLEDARAGRPHDGPLPAIDVPLQNIEEYNAGRLRERSRVLEPSEPVDAGRNSRRASDPATTELYALLDESDAGRFRDGVRRLLGLADARRDADGFRCLILSLCLPRARVAGADFAAELLSEVHPLLVRSRGRPPAGDRVLAEALRLAVRVGRADIVFKLAVLHFGPFLDAGDRGPLLQPVCGDCVLALARSGERTRLAELFDMISERVSAGGDWQAVLGPFRVPRKDSDSDNGRARCALGAAWRYLGNEAQASPILNSVRAVLAGNPSGPLTPLARANLGCRLASAATHASLDRAEIELRALFRLLDGLPSAFTTRTHFSILHCELVESVVLAVAHDDFAPPDHRRDCGDGERRERVALLGRLYDALPPLQC